MFELGTVDDVQMFFDCIDKYAMRQKGDARWNLITDRLYRRYLNIEDLPVAAELMSDIKSQFEKISPTEAKLEKQFEDKSMLDLNQETLAQVFGKFFDAFSSCKEGIELFFKRWNKYQPIRFVISDMPQLVNEKVRKLDQYDSLTGEPFWKR